MARINPSGSGSLPPLDVPEGGEIGAVQSGWRLALREFMSNRLAVIGFGILVFFVLFCFVGPLIYHTDQIDTNDALANLPPSAAHLLGADGQGFDELGRIMKGGQAALEIGFFAAFVAIIIGTLFGAVSGLAGGIVDSTLMRVVDVFLSVPFLFVVLILAVKYGATVLSLSLVIGAFSWQVPSRLVRGEVLTYPGTRLRPGRANGGCRQVVADQQAPAPQRGRRRHRQRDVPGRRRDPGRLVHRIPRLRLALPQRGLG